MARVTAESLMAPGGLLDAGSRLTQTLLTVPFERQRFKAGLDEKALMTKREDDRIAKTDKIGYLKDRISTTQQRIAELRTALNIGNRTEAMIAMRGLKKGATPSGLSHGAELAINAAEDKVNDYEKEQRKTLETKIGAALSAADEKELEKRTAAYRENTLKRVRADYPEEDWNRAATGPMSGGLTGIDLDMIKADPQLQTELDAALDQQSQLFGQYRELVGQAQDVADTHAFLQQAMPAMAPVGKNQPQELGVPGSNASDYTNLPAQPPMATLPGGDARKNLGNAVAGLSAPGAPPTATPLQGDQLADQQRQALPGLQSDVLALNDGIKQGQEAGMPADEIAKLQSQLQQKQAVQKNSVRHQLTSQAFDGVVTPETLAATDKILSYVQQSGHDMLNAELSGDVTASQQPKQINGSFANMAGGTPNPAATYQGPRMSSVLIPRIKALAPPGLITPAQAAKQKQVRSGLDARGLYPR